MIRHFSFLYRWSNEGVLKGLLDFIADTKLDFYSISSLNNQFNEFHLRLTFYL